MGRHTAGLNNFKGNRYEQVFALYRIVCLLGVYHDEGENPFFTIQAKCYVDDLVIEFNRPTISSVHPDVYYQLKNDQSITWGAKSGKLETEFRNQRMQCIRTGSPYQLAVVVPSQSRLRSLSSNLPDHLSDCTKVILFEELFDPSKLTKRPSIKRAVDKVAHANYVGLSYYEEIVRAFMSALLECAKPAQPVALEDLIGRVRQYGVSIRRYSPWSASGWLQAKSLLEKIPDFRFWTSRGYFEWTYGVTDSGAFEKDCDSENFERFVARVNTSKPVNFDELESLFP